MNTAVQAQFLKKKKNYLFPPLTNKEFKKKNSNLPQLVGVLLFSSKENRRGMRDFSGGDCV